MKENNNDDDDDGNKNENTNIENMYKNMTAKVKSTQSKNSKTTGK